MSKFQTGPKPISDAAEWAEMKIRRAKEAEADAARRGDAAYVIDSDTPIVGISTMETEYEPIGESEDDWAYYRRAVEKGASANAARVDEGRPSSLPT